MAYATRQDLEDAAGGAAAFKALADFDSDGNVDDVVVTRVQTVVEDMIDGYVRVRHVAPLVAPTAAIRRVAAEEIVYALRRDRRQLPSEDERLDHVERLAWLDGVAKGTVEFADPMPSKSANVRGSYIQNTSETSREKLKGFT